MTTRANPQRRGSPNVGRGRRGRGASSPAHRDRKYDQHEVACCGCGRRHTATRPQGARPGPVGYGPHMAAFAVYLMVMHFVPAHRVERLPRDSPGAN